MNTLEQVCSDILSENCELIKTLKREKNEMVKLRIAAISPVTQQIFDSISALQVTLQELKRKRYEVVSSFLVSGCLDTKEVSCRFTISPDCRKFTMNVGFIGKGDDEFDVDDLLKGISIFSEGIVHLVSESYGKLVQSSSDYRERLMKIEIEIEEITEELQSQKDARQQQESLHFQQTQKILEEGELYLKEQLNLRVGENTKRLMDTYDAIAKEWNAGKGIRCEHCNEVQKVDEERTISTYTRKGCREAPHYNFLSSGTLGYTCQKYE
jgi:hypothetical protein